MRIAPQWQVAESMIRLFVMLKIVLKCGLVKTNV
jgi:hypothetical protein